MRSFFFLLSLSCLSVSGLTRAQTPRSAPPVQTPATIRSVVAPLLAGPGDSLTGPASAAYQRGAIGRFFYGTHYRPTWEMPVTVPAFRPAALFGGLKPVKEGGSMQTLNLRFVDPKGQQYVLRSVDKDLTRALPDKAKKSMKARLLQDQTAAVHPYGALVAAELAQAAGVLHATPKLYRVPTTGTGLGEFEAAFAGRLVYLEERPDGDWQGQRAFAGSRQVVSSATLLTQRYGAENGAVRPPGLDVNGPGPARAYLRARLLDILLADWSRREDQWRWARFDAPAAENAVVRYRAVPRDRDHAFSRYSDGVFPGLAVLFRPKVVSFGPKIGRIGRYVETVETLDHVLLGWSSLADFTAEADSLRRRLSDVALDRALTRLPANVQRLDGRRFRQYLQQRREALPVAARQLYAVLNREVLLPGTDGPDDYTFSAGPNGGLTITWISRADSTGRGGASTYGRTFSKLETRRIQIHALGGADRLTLAGTLPKDGPAVEFFDGAGRDEAQRTGGGETPRWLKLQVSGDANRFDALPAWAKKATKTTAARDFDANGFLLRHRL
ncbi:MAG: hypothetical protein H7330_09445 [Hymenobacteraceae bacterium]|nr:hypothetical protein [Hymenobacteraceae bacterium]